MLPTSGIALNAWRKAEAYGASRATTKASPNKPSGNLSGEPGDAFAFSDLDVADGGAEGGARG